MPLCCWTMYPNCCSLTFVLFPPFIAFLSCETTIEASAHVIQPLDAPSLTALIMPLIVAWITNGVAT